MNQLNDHLKNAELSTEQNYNMIDGIMNNAPVAPAPPKKPIDRVKEPTEKRRSLELER